MNPADAPFPCFWWGIGLDDVGLDDVRPDVGTYGCYDFAKLPPLPFEMSGDFGWLAAAPHRADNIGKEKASENAAAIQTLPDIADRLGVRLPISFIRFMETPALQQKIRSNTDCFLDLCSELIPSPIGKSYLVRFLADSQGCVFWYLYLARDGADHCVVASTDFFGTEAEQWDDEKQEPGEIVFCAPTFENFLCRFWLENDIWYAMHEKKQLSDIGRQYIEDYRRSDDRP